MRWAWRVRVRVLSERVARAAAEEEDRGWVGGSWWRAWVEARRVAGWAKRLGVDEGLGVLEEEEEVEGEDGSMMEMTGGLDGVG